MEPLQDRNLSHSSFVFLGFPELRGHLRLLSLPFSLSYGWILLGNLLLVHVVRSLPSLHSPMYLLISALCLVDVLVVSAIIPRMLVGFFSERDAVSLAGCLLQMFVAHFLSSLESTLLLAMALDRYVAVCRPLRYADIINPSMAAKLCVFAVLRSGSIMLALVALAGSLTFCGSSVILHCYCDHMALVSLACGDTGRSNAMGLAVIGCFVGGDISLIFFSYVCILRAVLRTPDGDRWKAFHTCGTHLMVMMCFYLVGSVTFLSHNLRIPISTTGNTFMGLAYILLPATVNPVIYGVRTKEIRNGFCKVFNIRARDNVAGKVSSVKVSPIVKEPG